MRTLRTTAVIGIALLAAVMSAPGSRVAADAAIDPEVLTRAKRHGGRFTMGT